MVSADTKSVIACAKRIYAEQLQALLEPQHRDRFVAIEPESGDYFLGDTLDGEYPLLGTSLLDGHRLEVHCAAKTVELT